jgi:flavin-binding protein dodecin
MSVAKVTEISCSSPTSFEDAIATGIDRANRTLDRVKGAWVSELKVDVNDGKVVAYRVNMKVTFVLKD